MRKGSPSILPNSNARILEPMPLGLRVVWEEEKDQHTLYRGGAPLAGHHNGFSCRELAERMLAGNTERTLEQFDYIKACGGTHYVTREALS